MIGKTFKYNIYYPSGNTTALVLGEDALEYRQEINNSILNTNSTIEQVGFVFKTGENYYLEMAGGEFCGNATRSAVFYFLDGKDGEIQINVSGVKSPLKAGVKDGITFSEIPFINNSVSLVEVQSIEGITHIIKEISNSITKSEALEIAEEIINQYVKQIDSSPKALGVMFIRKNNLDYELTPVVKVFSVNTLFYETACGSGTACVGLYLHNKYSESISKLSVKQPSGEIIYVNIDFNDNQSVIGFIEGKQTIVAKNVEVTI